MVNIEDVNSAKIAAEIDSTRLDRIFTGSQRLAGYAVLDFTKCICQASREELSLNPPRIYSLQKLVEVAAYNMDRVRIVWSRMWKFLAEHFALMLPCMPPTRSGSSPWSSWSTRSLLTSTSRMLSSNLLCRFFCSFFFCLFFLFIDFLFLFF